MGYGIIYNFKTYQITISHTFVHFIKKYLMKNNMISLKIIFALLLLVTVIGCGKEEETNQLPTCEITAPVSGDEITKGETIIISVDADDADGNIVEVRFFIDGIGKGSASSFPFVYNWNTSNENIGTHLIKATSVDNNGGSTSDEITVKIVDGNSSPIANFSANFVSGSVPLTVTFTDQSTNAPDNWTWNFGDGGTSNQKNPDYTYNNAGSYTVTLIVQNALGSNTKTKTDYIIVSGNSGAPVVNFTASPESGSSPLTVTFSDQSTNNPTSWQWYFGDGSTSTQTNPIHIYNNAGTFSVTLTVTNEFGTDTEVRTNFIVVSGNGNIPIANFSSSTTIGTAPFEVIFTDLSINEPTSWYWSFGNGDSSTQPNPIYTYNNAGTYTVSLTVTNSYGSNTKTRTNYIIVSGGGATGSFTDDRDGQIYNTIDIGSQIWFAENLNFETNNSWWYNNNSTTGNIYGRLYTWDAALLACPNGWHLPSDAEWKILEMQLGMSQSEVDNTGWRGTDEGEKMKSTSRWHNNGNGTNSSGFTALPGGFRHSDGDFAYLGEDGRWWSSSQNYTSPNSWTRLLFDENNKVYRTTTDQTFGYSIRVCLLYDVI